LRSGQIGHAEALADQVAARPELALDALEALEHALTGDRAGPRVDRVARQVHAAHQRQQRLR
jgi:hypothetical protein